MGTMYQVNCECGYRLFDLLSGCGMAGVSFELFYCEDCSNVMSKWLFRIPVHFKELPFVLSPSASLRRALSKDKYYSQHFQAHGSTGLSWATPKGSPRTWKFIS